MAFATIRSKDALRCLRVDHHRPLGPRGSKVSTAVAVARARGLSVSSWK